MSLISDRRARTRVCRALVLWFCVALIVYAVRLAAIRGSPALSAPPVVSERYYAAASSDSARTSLEPILTKHKALVEEVWQAPTSQDWSKAHEIPIEDLPDSREDWAHRFPRTKTDLLEMFLGKPDGVTVHRLVRHVVLNKPDIPLSDAEISFLEVVVRLRKEPLRKLFRNYRIARNQEMLQLARSGTVESIEVPELDEGQIERVVQQIRQAMAPNTDLGRMSIEELRQFVKANPPKGAALPGQSFFSTFDGGTYLFRQFPELPYSDRMFEDLKFFAGQFLAEVASWFESHGYASGYEVGQVLDSVATFHPRTLRQIR